MVKLMRRLRLSKANANARRNVMLTISQFVAVMALPITMSVR